MSAFHAEDRGSIPLGTTIRDVAQSGSAPALGAGCRGFKSLHPDHGRLAQLEEHLVYTERVGGSSPSSPTIHT